MTGPGKYDALATQARKRANAIGVILIIIGGEHGHGFSAQLPEFYAPTIPEMLHELAHQIEAELAKAGN